MTLTGLAPVAVATGPVAVPASPTQADSHPQVLPAPQSLSWGSDAATFKSTGATLRARLQLIQQATSALMAMQASQQSALTPRVDDMDSDFTVKPASITASVVDGVFNAFVDDAAKAWNKCAALTPVKGGRRLRLSHPCCLDSGSR